MNKVVTGLLAFTLLGGGMALAQTSAPAAGSSPSAAPTVGSTTTPGTTATPATPSATMPGATTPGTAAATSPSTSAAPAAVNTTTEPSRTTQAPVPGANSFTESQAKARMEDNGYTNVAELKKDEQGIWRAAATKDGRQVIVTLDYQGNVAVQ